MEEETLPRVITVAEAQNGDLVRLRYDEIRLEGRLTIGVSGAWVVGEFPVSRPGDYELTLLDRPEPAPQVEPNRADAEDCEACAGLDHPCLYHEGQYAGAALLADVIRAAIGDAQSTDRPAFDSAATLPPARAGEAYCGAGPLEGWVCGLPINHYHFTPRVAWLSGDKPRYIWGDLR